MKRAIAAVFASGFVSAAWAQQGLVDGATAERIVKARPDVRWDLSSLVEGDFNDDGKKDFAILGYKKKIVVLAVRASSGKKGEFRTQYLQFGIDASLQAAICKAPGSLLVEEQNCNPMDEALPGCKPSKTANSLVLSDGSCDPINLYWNTKGNRMEWWRL